MLKLSDANLLRLESTRGSKASMILWALSKRLKFLGSDELKDVVISKVKMKALAATARPIDADELLEFFGLEQVQSEWRLWRDRLTKLGRVFKDDSEFDSFLVSFFREEVMQRDGFQCFLCGKPLSPMIVSLHHIFWDKGILYNVPSNLITFCPECHEKVGCKGC
ncbi:MAG: HNH endonuclease [Nitrososphaerales archaeon]